MLTFLTPPPPEILMVRPSQYALNRREHQYMRQHRLGRITRPVPWAKDTHVYVLWEDSDLEKVERVYALDLLEIIDGQSTLAKPEKQE